MTRSAAIYRFQCNICGTKSEQPSDSVPEGWTEIVIKQKGASDITAHLCPTDTTTFKNRLTA